MGRLLMGGVCERFPDLKLLFLESGGGWVPTQLERMDEQVEAFPLERRKLSLLPSEYFRRQCWVCFEAEEWNLAACAEHLGPDRVLWATDYPHPEYHPGVVDELREHLAPLDDTARDMILGKNAVRRLRPRGLRMTDLDLASTCGCPSGARPPARRAMRDAGIDAAVLLGQSNVGYATGARVPAADQARAIHRRSVALVTADDETPHLWTWFPEGAPPDLPADRVHPGIGLEWQDGARSLLDAVTTWAPPGGTMAFDEVTMPLRSAAPRAGHAAGRRGAGRRSRRRHGRRPTRSSASAVPRRSTRRRSPTSRRSCSRARPRPRSRVGSCAAPSSSARRGTTSTRSGR